MSVVGRPSGGFASFVRGVSPFGGARLGAAGAVWGSKSSRIKTENSDMIGWLRSTQWEHAVDVEDEDEESR